MNSIPNSPTPVECHAFQVNDYAYQYVNEIE